MPKLSDGEFAKAVLDAGLLTPEMVKECEIIQKRVAEMGLLHKDLREIMVEKGYVAEEVARKIARGEQAQEAKKKEKVVRIGGYEVITRLGKGQMGSVYKARQVSLDRLVALKVLPSRLASDKRYRDRFLREAKAAGKLNHPNIVTAVDFGESGGLYFYAMDYVDGADARSILEEEGKLGEDEALAITLQIAKALEHAHKNNIIHRDIKPANIIVDSEGRARLCDLGLAREVGEGHALTQAGVVLGTPYYVSPEQAEGRRDLDTRSDIYSLGITLFHMVTGQVPFKGSSGPDIMIKHVTEKLPDPRDFNTRLSNGTVQLIKKMTAKDREKRYQAPGGLIKDIERVIAGERPAAAGPVIRARQSRRPGALYEQAAAKAGAGKKMVPLIVIGVVVLLLVVAVATIPRKTWRPGGSTEQPADDTGGTTGRPVDDMQPSPLPEPDDEVLRDRLSSDKRELINIMEWARSHRSDVAAIAAKYRDFVENATDEESVRTAKQALEGIATREFMSLQGRFNSLFATGKVKEALKEALAYVKLFGKTRSAQKATPLVNKAKKEIERLLNKEVSKAKSLAQQGKFSEALEVITAASALATKELKGKLSAAKAQVEKMRREQLTARRAEADATRGKFDEDLAASIRSLDLNTAVSLIEERIQVETEPSRIESLRSKATDIREAGEALNLVVANLKNLKNMKRTFSLKKEGDVTGIIEKVDNRSFVLVLDTDGSARGINLTQLSSSEFVRLAELNIGHQEGKTRYQLGLLLLFVLEDPKGAKHQFAKARKLGIDTSRFGVEEKIADSHLEELIAAAEKDEKRKKFVEAALAYYNVLVEMGDKEAYADRKKEIQQKIDYCMRESGLEKLFKGKVSIENGRFSVFYDFSEQVQLEDFEPCVWDKKEDLPHEWFVEKEAILGKGMESLLWKGIFSGDVTYEVDVTPVSPSQPSFLLRVCDDGKGRKGKNYTFLFGYKITEGKKPKQTSYRGNVLFKWRKRIKRLYKGRTPRIVARRTFKIKIERADRALRATVDGNVIMKVTDKDLKRGGISFGITNSTVRFDNFRVTGDFDMSWLDRELKKIK